MKESNMSELRQLIERLKHGKHDQSTHGRRGRRGGGGASSGASASSDGSSKPSKNDDISYAKQQLDRVDSQISKLEQRRVNGKFPSNEMEAQHRELLSARAEYQDEIRRNTPDSSQAIRPYKPIVEPATSSESRQANRDDRALIAQSKSEITRLQGMKKTAQDAIARGGETQPDGTFRQYSQGEMDYYKREVATNDRFIESNQRTIQIANDRIRGRKNGEVSASSSRASKPVRTNSEPVQTNNDIDPFVTQQLGRINRRIAKIEAERINGVLTPIQQRALDRALSDKRDYEDELRRNQYQ